MTTTLRDRAEHAARYDANLVVPATEIKQLLDQLDIMTSAAKAALDANKAAEDALARVRRVADRAERHYNTLSGAVMATDIHRALDGAALAEETPR